MSPLHARTFTFTSTISARLTCVSRVVIATAAIVIALALPAQVAQAQTGQWALRSPATSPGGRSAHAMAYDPIRRETIVFGGYGGPGGYWGDTWGWDGTSWTLKATTGPSPRANVDMAFDTTRGVMVLFGGYFGGSVLGDTWEWNGSSWMQRMPAGPTPTARSDYGIVFDSARNVTVMTAGGGTSSLFSDTWEWNGATWTARVDVNGPVRGGPAMAFDSLRGRTVLFGGDVANNAAGMRSDTFEFDGTIWSFRTASGPSPRRYAPMAYDPIRGVCVVTGGNFFGQSVGGTFAWNGTNWSELAVGGPGPWQGHKLAFDTSRNELVQFGGTSGGVGTNQTWVLQTLQPIVRDAFDPALGTLPSAQGWSLVEIGEVSPPYAIVNGELRQGPTSASGNQVWQRDNAQADFATSAGQIAEVNLRVISSTDDPNGNGPGRWRTGFALTMVDANLRFVSLGITSSGVRLSIDRNNAASGSVSVPMDTTSAMRRYRVVVTSAGTRLLVDDVLVASLGLPPTSFAITPKIYLGDESIGSCEVRIGKVRLGTFGPTLPLALAGPNDNATVSGNRPDPGSGATTTYNVGSFTVESGSSWTLGSGEILNAPGGLVVQQGAVLIANGTINGPLVNNGLLIVPITQAGLISRVVPGPSRGVIIIPVPQPTPGVPPTPIPVPLPNPPAIEPGEIIVISGNGPGAGAGSGGGGGGGGAGGGGGTVRFVTPSLPVQGTLRLDSLLEVTGPVTQSATGVTRLFIAGTTRGETYSAVDSEQSISLDGGIQVVLRPEMFDYTPSVGDTFDVMFAPGGITLPDGNIELSTFLTPAGAARLGISLPSYISPFAADPDVLVQFPSSLFSYSIVNGGTTLRLTMTSGACSPIVSASEGFSICPGPARTLSVTPLGSGPFTFQWRKRTTAEGTPVNIADDGRITGATSATLNFASVANEDTGFYDCVVTRGGTCGSSIIAPIQVFVGCSNRANVASSNQGTTCDEALSADDIIVFLNWYFAGDLRADFAGPNQSTTPDGTFTADDIIVFLSLYFAGC